MIDPIQVKYLNVKRWKILKIRGKISSMDVKEEGLFKKDLWEQNSLECSGLIILWDFDFEDRDYLLFR